MVNKTTDCEGKKEKIKIFFLYTYINIPKFLNIGCLLRKKKSLKGSNCRNYEWRNYYYNFRNDNTCVF